MSRPVVLTLALSLVATVAAARRPAGPPADAATCARARLANGGKLMAGVLRCAGRAAASGGRLAKRCEKQAIVKYAKALKKVDRPGTCVHGLDALTAATVFAGYAEAIAGEVHPNRRRSRCDAAKLKAAGDAAATVLPAVAGARETFDMGTLDAARSGAAAALSGAFATAEQRPDCQSYLDAPTVQLVIENVAGLAGPLRGWAQLAKVVAMPADAQADATANQAVLQANGLTVTDGGASIVGPTEGASGWTAELGDQRARLDAGGLFVLDVPGGGPLEGKLYHPSDPTTPVARFFIVELAGPAELVPSAIAMELRAAGSCGMDENPALDPPSCHSTASQAAARAARSATATERGAVEGLTPQQELFCQDVWSQGLFNPDPTAHPPLLNGALGTYPNTDPAAQQCSCLDYDGYVQTGERGDSGVKGAIAFPGSTCAKQVLLGCCDNEAATIRRQILSVIDEYHFPVLHCPVNHKGNRFCQSVTKGDLAVQVKGEVARGGDTLEFTLQHGENVAVRVHNNGCYGDTTVSPGLFNDAGGVLAGDRFDGETLQHHDVYGTYYTDSDLTYFSNADCPHEGASDKYEFSVDDSDATVVFHCTPTSTTTTTCPGMQGSCVDTTSTTTTTETTTTTTTP